MECNREGAETARQLAEQKLQDGDLAGCVRFLEKARRLFPTLERLDQIDEVLRVHQLAAAKNLSGDIDYYSVLRLEPFTNDDEQIKKAFRKMALLLHPDKNKVAGADAAFKVVKEAHSCLSDKLQKAQYDLRRKARSGSGGRNNVNVQNYAAAHAAAAAAAVAKATKAAAAKAQAEQRRQQARQQQQQQHQQQWQQQQQQWQQQAQFQQQQSQFWEPPPPSQFYTRCQFCSTVMLCKKEARGHTVECLICKRKFQAVEVVGVNAGAAAAPGAPAQSQFRPASSYFTQQAAQGQPAPGPAGAASGNHTFPTSGTATGAQGIPASVAANLRAAAAAAGTRMGGAGPPPTDPAAAAATAAAAAAAAHHFFQQQQQQQQQQANGFQAAADGQQQPPQAHEQLFNQHFASWKESSMASSGARQAFVNTIWEQVQKSREENEKRKREEAAEARRKEQERRDAKAAEKKRKEEEKAKRKESKSSKRKRRRMYASESEEEDEVEEEEDDEEFTAKVDAELRGEDDEERARGRQRRGAAEEGAAPSGGRGAAGSDDVAPLVEAVLAAGLRAAQAREEGALRRSKRAKRDVRYVETREVEEEVEMEGKQGGVAPQGADSVQAAGRATEVPHGGAGGSSARGGVEPVQAFVVGGSAGVGVSVGVGAAAQPAPGVDAAQPAKPRDRGSAAAGAPRQGAAAAASPTVPAAGPGAAAGAAGRLRQVGIMDLLMRKAPTARAAETAQAEGATGPASGADVPRGAQHEKGSPVVDLTGEGEEKGWRKENQAEPDVVVLGSGGASVSVQVERPAEDADLKKDVASGDGGEEEERETTQMEVADPDFYDFDRDREEKDLKEGQVWAMYDDEEGFPRFYSYIQKVHFSGSSFRCRISWLELCSPGPSPAHSAVSSASTARPGGPQSFAPPHFSPVGWFKAKGGSKWERTVNVFAFPVQMKGPIPMPTAKAPLLVLPYPDQVWAVHLAEYAEKGVWDKYGLAVVDFIPGPHALEGSGRSDNWVNLRPTDRIRGSVPVRWLRLLKGYTNVYEVRNSSIKNVDLSLFSHMIPSKVCFGDEVGRRVVPPPPTGSIELDTASIPTDVVVPT